MSGWIIITGCWSSGFRPAPSDRVWPGGSFSKGSVTKQISTRKKIEFASRTAVTQGMSVRFWRRFVSTQAVP